MPTDETGLYQLHHFCGDFAAWIRSGMDVRFCFVIGAGASRNSGIPTGSTLADEWLQVRFRQERPDTEVAGITSCFPQPGLSCVAECCTAD